MLKTVEAVRERERDCPAKRKISKNSCHKKMNIDKKIISLESNL